jgi:hypothetical protein
LHDSFVPQRFCQRHRLVPLTACVSGILRAMHGHSKQARPLLLIAPGIRVNMRDARQSSQWLVEPTEQQKQTTDGTSRTWSNSYATACANAFRTVPRTLSVIVQWPLSWSQPFRSPRRSGVVS